MARSWYDPREDVEWEFDPIVPSECIVTENPVIGRLLGPAGEVLIEFHERPVTRLGFRPNSERDG